MDRGVLERLAALEFDTLKREVKSYLSDHDLRALLSRRDAIVAHFRAGGERVMYDRRDTATTCRATHPPVSSTAIVGTTLTIIDTTVSPARVVRRVAGGAALPVVRLDGER